MMKEQKENREVEKLMNFSEVYGLGKKELLQQLDKSEVHKLTIQYLTNFPKTVHVAGLRKLKSKAMVEAMWLGAYVSGNHKVVYDKGIYLFLYMYRGTIIYSWDAYNDIERVVDAGVYEDTASTRNQRKEIQKSIENFKDAVLKL